MSCKKPYMQAICHRAPLCVATPRTQHKTKGPARGLPALWQREPLQGCQQPRKQMADVSITQCLRMPIVLTLVFVTSIINKIRIQLRQFAQIGACKELNAVRCLAHLVCCVAGSACRCAAAIAAKDTLQPTGRGSCSCCSSPTFSTAGQGWQCIWQAPLTSSGACCWCSCASRRLLASMTGWLHAVCSGCCEDLLVLLVAAV